MKDFITLEKIKKSIFGILFWLILWQISANLINDNILLPGPNLVIKSFFILITSQDTWVRLGLSLMKILVGFIFAVIFAIIFSYFSFKCKWLDELMILPMNFMKSVPVTSFVVILLIWTDSEILSIFISFILALPIIYQNLRTGFQNLDKKMMEMADIYHISEKNRICTIYYFQMKPQFTSSILTVSGMMIKAGIAAEIIGLPPKSIGESIFQAKLYLQMDLVFAWTILIVLTSVILEKFLKRMIHLG